MAAFVVFFYVTATNAQSTKPFQGTITYDVAYTGANLTPAQKAQLPTSQVVTVKECKTKTEVVSGPMTQEVITDGTTKTETVLIDMGSAETKFAIKFTAEQITEELAKAPMPTVNITKVTKVISGYTCKQAILTTKQEDGTTTTDTIYFTESIGCADLNFGTQFKDIPGAVLQYSEYIAQAEATASYTVKEIKKSKVSDNVFLTPSDFKEVTKDELKKMFGGD